MRINTESPFIRSRIVFWFKVKLGNFFKTYIHTSEKSKSQTSGNVKAAEESRFQAASGYGRTKENRLILLSTLYEVYVKLLYVKYYLQCACRLISMIVQTHAALNLVIAY